MRKNVVFGLLSVVVGAISTLTGYAQLTTLTEGFDTVGTPGPPSTGIFASGWVVINNSNPIGDHTWNQGIPGTQTDGLGVNAQSDPPSAANAFIQTDFNAGMPGSGAIVSDWLITPVLLLENGATMSFYTQASPDNTQFPNELQVWESLSGSSTVNVGSTTPNPGGDFTNKLLDINTGATNPSGAPGGYPTTWTEYTFTISGLSAPTDGRFGFRFYLPNNNTDGTIVGIDTFSFADPTLFTRTVTGNWSDSTGWTPSGVPNGNNNIANLVLPASGTQTVNLQGGTFTVNQLNVTGVGAGAWTVSNGTLVFDGTTPTFTNQSTSTGVTATLSINLQLNTDTTFNTQNAGAITALNGTISGAGNVIITGLGTFLINTAQNYSTETIINQGTFEAGAANVFSANSAVILSAGGTLNLGNSNQTIASLSGTGGQVILSTNSSSPATLTTGADNTSASYAGTISGFGGLNKVGTGTLTLSGTTTYTGTTNISAGTIAGGALNSLSPNSAFTIANGATLDISAASQIIGSLSGVMGSNVNLGAQTLTIGGDNTSTTFSGLISGTGSLIKNGAGTFTILGTNTYSGGTSFNGGIVAVDSDANLGTGPLSFNGGTLEALAAGGGITSTKPVTLNAGGGTFLADTGTASTLSGAISGVGTFTKNGLGTLTLTGANTYTGATTVVAGALALGSGGSIASSSGLTLFAAGTGFDISAGGNQTIQDLSGVAGSRINLGANTLTAGTANSTSFAGVIFGTGALTKQGTGTLTLSGANTYSGATTVDAGTLALGLGGSIASSSGLTLFAAGTGFDISAGGNQTIQDLSGVAGSTINLGANTLTAGTANSTSCAGVISGTGGLTKQGSGTLTLSGANTYLGATTVDAGTLALGLGGSIASSSGLTLFASGTGFDISAGGNETIKDLSGVAGSTINLGANTLTAGTANSTSFAGVISGTGGLTKQGRGTLILTGNNTYTGGTTVNAGTLQIGSGETSGSIAGDVSDNATFAFDRSDSITFGGLISGTGALVQMGSGTVTLTAENSYGGGTTIDTGASLQLGNDGPTGSIIGNVTDNGSLIFNRSGNVTFNAIISGSGNLVQNGSGTTVLGGANTYSGGTIINNGTLLVNNSQALGLGNVVVNGGVLGADPQPINVKGNYTQNAGGTLQLQVAGANPGQYDTLNVGADATLGGTLQLISLGFQPEARNQLTLVTSGGIVSGQFAHFVDPFSVRPGLNTIDLIYGKQSVVLEFLNQTTPVSPVIPTVPTVPTSPSVVPPTVIATINFASFALTPNQSAAANLVDQVELDPKAADLVGFLFKEPFANLPGDFEKISPEGLTAFYEISFSNANIQKLTLESRLDDIHNGSNGFSSNMKVNGATANREDKTAVDGKTSKSVVEPVLQPGPENRWGVWVTGFGDFVNVDGDGNAKGYDFTTGGVSVGVDYRITDHLAIGVMGEYAHTWTSLKPSGDIDVDSGRGGVYATWYNHGVYFNGAIYGGHNTYESSRAGLGGLATGGTEGAEWSTFISGGYDFHFGQLTVGPIASLQYTDVGIDGFSENGSLAPLAIHSGSAESLRSDFGFRAFYQWQIGKILVEPSLKAAWEHEYKYSALPITAGFAGIPGPSATFFGPNEGHDSAIVSAGVSVQWTPMIATYVNYDGQLGRGNYDSNAVTGGVRISF